jgi:hypothetical protein
MTDAERQMLGKAVALLLQRGNELFSCPPVVSDDVTITKETTEKETASPSTSITKEASEEDLMDDFFVFV